MEVKMTALESILNSQPQAVLVIQGNACRMLNASDADPSMVFVTLPDGGYYTMCRVLFSVEGDDLTDEAKLLIASIDAMLTAAYNAGLDDGQQVVSSQD